MLEHELSGRFDVPHAAGMTALWSSWARQVYRDAPGRFARLGTEVFGLPYTENELQTAENAIHAMEDFFDAMHMPRTLGALGIRLTEEDLQALAAQYMDSTGGMAGSIRRLTTEDVLAILKDASQ